MFRRFKIGVHPDDAAKGIGGSSQVRWQVYDTDTGKRYGEYPTSRAALKDAQRREDKFERSR